MADIGYVVAFELLSHEEFGGCTARKRAYLVCINVARTAHTPEVARQIAKSIMETVLHLKVKWPGKPLTVDKFLLEPDDPYIGATQSTPKELRKTCGHVTCGACVVHAAHTAHT